MRKYQVTIAALFVFCAMLFLSVQGFCAPMEKDYVGKVNVNTATLEELTLLPEVGPKTAERIISYRKANGSFKNVADLANVKGIGEKKIQRFSKFVKFDGKTDLHIEKN